MERNPAPGKGPRPNPTKTVAGQIALRTPADKKTQVIYQSPRSLNARLQVPYRESLAFRLNSRFILGHYAYARFDSTTSANSPAWVKATGWLAVFLSPTGFFLYS